MKGNNKNCRDKKEVIKRRAPSELKTLAAKLISEKDKASEIPVSVLELSNWRETSPSFFPTSTMAQWNKDAKTLITETSKGRQTNSRLSLCAMKEAQPLFLSLFILPHQRYIPRQKFRFEALSLICMEIQDWLWTIVGFLKISWRQIIPQRDGG